MKFIASLLFSISLLCAFTGCGKKNAEKGVVEVEKPPIAVELNTAAASDISEGIEVTGSLEPKFSVDVRTQIPGLVREVMVTEWVRVKKGQPLIRIDVAETDAQVKRAEAGIASAKANQAQAQVSANRADRELARVLKLKESGLATQQALDDAKSESEAAKARVAVSSAQIQVAEEELRQGSARRAKSLVAAPIDGVVSLRDVNVGDLTSDAATARPIFRIVDNRLLNLTMTVSSVDSSRVKSGQTVNFSVDSNPGRIYSGKVMYINPELSSSDRSLKVIAEVRNIPEVLKGGLFAKGRIVTGNRTQVLQVPRSAIGSFNPEAKKGNLFIVKDGVATIRQIGSGSVTGDMVEIVSGLKAGEQYVIRGGFNLKDGDKVAVATSK
ncbi:MAG: efflux RND transporter periplasmic adaptor subunit [Desulfuromonadaceae bacterium]|nr:efflux RND transporter periplasmic adaptor subunit [Desulfuromonadaceae bacterium]MDD2856206.1 efflux RND transporter periplasmic adaptor subunit [Desulfuromonadaceae bacterium]